MIILITLSIFLSPVFFILKLGIGSWDVEGEMWKHLYQTMLPLYVSNTLILIIGSGFLATVLGILTAWIVTFYRFPGRNYLVWLLLLPFAFPSYLIAFIYTEIFDYPGPIQTILRTWTDWGPQDYWFPEIRSLPGAIIFFAISLYPYVYMFARKAFLEQSQFLQQTAQVFGLSSRQLFFKISWPLTRPAIVLGVFLVMMEILADFGTVSYFSIPTLSLGAYNFWINMGSLEGAIHIAIITLILILAMIYLEKWQRSKKRHFENNQQPLPQRKLQLPQATLAIIITGIPILIGFIIPFLVLIYFSIITLRGQNSHTTITEYLLYSWNSISLAFLIASLTCVIAFLIVKAVVTHKSKVIHTVLPAFSIGYALPGTLLGIGIIPVVMSINVLIENIFFIGGTLLVVIFAYVIRFIIIPLGSIETGHRKISENIYHSANILGKTRWERALTLDIPLLKKCIFTAFIIVFVDVMKELPLMIILRPLNYENLATHVFTYASNENLTLASPSALTIVLLGLLPVILLTRHIDHARKTEVNFLEWKQ